MYMVSMSLRVTPPDVEPAPGCIFCRQSGAGRICAFAAPAKDAYKHSSIQDGLLDLIIPY